MLFYSSSIHIGDVQPPPQNIDNDAYRINAMYSAWCLKAGRANQWKAAEGILELAFFCPATEYPIN
jgi:hypothetical protein